MGIHKKSFCAADIRRYRNAGLPCIWPGCIIQYRRMNVPGGREAGKWPERSRADMDFSGGSIIMTQKEKRSERPGRVCSEKRYIMMRQADRKAGRSPIS